MKRKISASRETGFMASNSPKKIVKVYSVFPVDRADCVCQEAIRKFKMHLATSKESDRRLLLAETPYIVCPRDKTGMSRYAVICAKCHEVQGQCWARDASLNDWCDFHYVQWTNGDYWRGCLTPHISPITQQLLFECCCGNDIRDFRANMTLNQKTSEYKEKQNSIGREFNQPNSKFIVKKL